MHVNSLRAGGDRTCRLPRKLRRGDGHRRMLGTPEAAVQARLDPLDPSRHPAIVHRLRPGTERTATELQTVTGSRAPCPPGQDLE